MSKWEIIEADVLGALQAMPADSFDACLCDPPYGLGNREPTVDEIVAYLTADAAMDTGGCFMGAEWSVPSAACWRELYRVLKPGAHVFSFAGTRTVDLIMLGLRAGGFEIRDSLACWLYGQGYAKSLDGERAVSMATCPLPGRHFSSTLPKGKKLKDGDHLCPTTAEGARFEGVGTAMKPAHEPVVLARKPLAFTVAGNLMAYETGGLDIDAGRLGFASAEDERVSKGKNQHAAHENGARTNTVFGADNRQLADYDASGRLPPNVVFSHGPECRPVGRKRVKGANFTGHEPRPADVHRSVYGESAARAPTCIVDPDGTEEVEARYCEPSCPVRALDGQSGERPSTLTGRADPGSSHEHPSDADSPHVLYGHGLHTAVSRVYADAGGASRFFKTVALTDEDFRYVPKASRFEREFGCDGLPYRTGAEAVHREEGSAGLNPRAGAGRTAEKVRNYGPCVKPVALTRWLAALILPRPHADGRPRRLIVPFCGTGSEIVGGLRAGFDEVVGIQRVADDDERGFVAIARARLARWDQVPATMSEQDAVTESRTATKDVHERQEMMFK